jgi:hypothetical protein
MGHSCVLVIIAVTLCLNCASCSPRAMSDESKQVPTAPVVLSDTEQDGDSAAPVVDETEQQFRDLHAELVHLKKLVLSIHERLEKVEDRAVRQTTGDGYRIGFRENESKKENTAWFIMSPPERGTIAFTSQVGIKVVPGSTWVLASEFPSEEAKFNIPLQTDKGWESKFISRTKEEKYRIRMRTSGGTTVYLYIERDGPSGDMWITHVFAHLNTNKLSV